MRMRTKMIFNEFMIYQCDHVHLHHNINRLADWDDPGLKTVLKKCDIVTFFCK